MLDIDRTRIRTVERSLGSQGSFAKNFLGSIGVGALLVGTSAAATHEPSCSDCWGPSDRKGAFAIGAIGGAILAIPVGVILGVASQSDRWETMILPPSADVALLLRSSADGRLGAGVRLAIARRRPR